MPTLTVNNIPFNYPDAGQQGGGGDPSIGYGEDATAWAEEVTGVLASLLSAGDIIETTTNILDGATLEDVAGLNFSISVTREATVQYTITRSTTTPSSMVESGFLYLTYDPVGTIWYLGQTKTENAQVVFSITSTGQVQYTSSSMGGPGYTGKITFKADTLSI